MAVPVPGSQEMEGAVYHKVCLDRDGVVRVLTDRGVARVVADRLVPDRSHRPLAAKRPQDLTVAHGSVYYLLEDRLLSNDLAGQYAVALPSGQYRACAVAHDGRALLAGATNLALVVGTQWVAIPFLLPRQGELLYAWGPHFYVLAGDAVYRVSGPRLDLVHRGRDLTVLGFRGNEVLVGTRRGYYGVDLVSGAMTLPMQDRLPCVDVTALVPQTNGVWVGTTRGVFFHGGPRWIRYYASKRWLPDDRVLGLAAGSEGDLHVLTERGLGRIEFRSLTLAEKATYYDDKIRQRHMRYGFCSELHLAVPGDLTTAELIDTDNDGSWSSYYLASQAFRYAVTREEKARENAWETFGTLERLQAITGLDGFPARTFERTGFKVSDPERWRPAADRHWEWKGHTSSDEITAQTFAYAVLYEVAARTPAERGRIAAAYDRIAGHLLRNHYTLVDADGQPTLWGRWAPEYVNRYPPTIGDRRLNSAEIIAFLQFAHRVTGKPVYQERGFELLEKHGYLQNLTNSMAMIRPTPGFVYQGYDMGDEWNHSDDLLAFVNYWTLYRYAFNDALRRQYAAAIRDHFEIEQGERCPLWSFVTAMTGHAAADLEGALWTLQAFPLDLVTHRIENSHRRDVTRLEPNFRHQEIVELLPADERPVMRWNGNPYQIDGGDGGHGELAGDEFLLPYWMGRYLRLIE